MGLRKDLRVWAMGWLALLAIFPNDLSAQPATRKEKVKAAAGVVERIFSAHAAARHLPGLAWGVIYDGGLVISGGCGLADLGQQRPATPQSLFPRRLDEQKLHCHGHPAAPRRRQTAPG